MRLGREEPIALSLRGDAEQRFYQLSDHQASVVIAHQSQCDGGRQLAVVRQAATPREDRIGGPDQCLIAPSVERTSRPLPFLPPIPESAADLVRGGGGGWL